ncbi:MAG: hypothetical protein IJT24_07655 [Lachnospiraceae bacterium]|nr:hypothetical protein [Lachnospiraceae bacterium]
MWNGNGERSNTVYFVRILVGAYLLYIDYQIFNDVMDREGAGRIAMMVFMVLFAIVGTVLILMSARQLLGLSSGKDKKKDEAAGLPEDEAEATEDDAAGAAEDTAAEDAGEEEQ